MSIAAALKEAGYDTMTAKRRITAQQLIVDCRDDLALAEATLHEVARDMGLQLQHEILRGVQPLVNGEIKNECTSLGIARRNRATTRAVAAAKLQDDIYENTVIFGRRLSGLYHDELPALIKQMEEAIGRMSRDLALARMLLNHVAKPMSNSIRYVVGPGPLAGYISEANKAEAQSVARE